MSTGTTISAKCPDCHGSGQRQTFGAAEPVPCETCFGNGNVLMLSGASDANGGEPTCAGEIRGPLSPAEREASHQITREEMDAAAKALRDAAYRYASTLGCGIAAMEAVAEGELRRAAVRYRNAVEQRGREMGL